MIRLLHFIETKWIAITLSILSAITFLSLWPLENLPSVPGTDKTHHIIAYAALMFPTALRKPKKWMLIGLFFIAYSGTIEFVQPYINRYGDWLDMAANTAGVICGLVLAELVIYLFPSRYRTTPRSTDRPHGSPP
ncbi:MAG: VanZ family protein [Candidatus Thiosymbion ectosymbiont of Robbea hypermnestra]|nr:VanZ family protein [Candidatus Thiosymbion ectosymbiont of Robbea hypermnestra]